MLSLEGDEMKERTEKDGKESKTYSIGEYSDQQTNHH